MRVRVVLALVALTVPALGADLPQLQPRSPPVLNAIPEVYNWTGWYIGGAVGGIWGKEDFNVTGGGPTTQYAIQQGLIPNPSFNMSGIAGGPLIGGNWQVPGTRWVLGAEAEWDFTSLSQTVNNGVNGLVCSGGTCFTQGTQMVPQTTTQLVTTTTDPPPITTTTPVTTTTPGSCTSTGGMVGIVCTPATTTTTNVTTTTPGTPVTTTSPVRTTTMVPMPTFSPAAGSTISSFSERLTDLALLTGRVGWSFGNLMPYIRAGLAVGRVEASGYAQASSAGCGSSFGCPPFAGSGATWRAGYAAGGGVEWWFARNWIARIDAIYYGLPGRTFNVPSQFDTLVVNTNGVSGFEVKGGLLFRFNGPYNGA